jgi:hypothetical protein
MTDDEDAESVRLVAGRSEDAVDRSRRPVAVAVRRFGFDISLAELQPDAASVAR